MSDIDRKRLFIASCVAVAATGIVFSIRGDILEALGHRIPAAAFRYVAGLPAILTVIFVALFIHYQSRGGYRPVALGARPLRCGGSLMKRRDFLQSVVTVPAGAVLLEGSGEALSPASAQGTTQAVPPRPPTVPEATAQDAVLETVSAEEVAALTPRYLSAVQFATLRRLSDLLLPALAPNPGALAAQAPQFIDNYLAVCASDRQRLYRDGLDDLNKQSQSRFKKPFADLSTAEADAIVKPLFKVRGPTMSVVESRAVHQSSPSGRPHRHDELAAVERRAGRRGESRGAAALLAQRRSHRSSFGSGAMANQDLQVLIIGSGHAGGMAAYVLAQKGIRCLMLNAGPARGSVARSSIGARTPDGVSRADGAGRDRRRRDRRERAERVRAPERSALYARRRQAVRVGA